ncbi:Ferritin heavy chain [Tupaia chinensis]|uniref:Ferritin n=1 Tax=Tupaia chinensis TaxID=246437 RepID=L9LA67_TUPCH|nr:Ferritin heavy chain [Tupaia chinensis]
MTSGQTFSAKLQRFPASTVLELNLALIPHPSRPPRACPVLCHHLTAPSDCCKVPTVVTASPQPPAMMTRSPLQVRQSYHQDGEAAIKHQINLELYTSCVHLSRTFYFDPDDVASKDFAKYFLHQSHEERERMRNGRSCRIKEMATYSSGNQETRSCREWTECMECAFHLGKNTNQSLLELHNPATAINDPRLCDSIETHYLNEQIKSIKELSARVTNMGMAGYLCGRHTLGDTDNESSA